MLDEGTYAVVKEPRSPHRLALDGSWHQISPRYVVSQLLQYGITIALLVAAVLVAVLVFDQTWAWIPGGVFFAILLFTVIILPRQARAIGYMLRSDDVVFRKGSSGSASSPSPTAACSSSTSPTARSTGPSGSPS
nr:hypothetical protein [Microbacterium sp. NIBRBAC000506063]